MLEEEAHTAHDQLKHNITEQISDRETESSSELDNMVALADKAVKLANCGYVDALDSEAFSGLSPRFLAGVRATAYRVAALNHDQNIGLQTSEDQDKVAKMVGLTREYQTGLTNALLESASGVTPTEEDAAHAIRIINENKQRKAQKDERPGQY